MCGEKDCARSYNTEYQRWRRRQQVVQGNAQRGHGRKSEEPRWLDLAKVITQEEAEAKAEDEAHERRQNDSPEALHEREGDAR